MNEVKEEKSVVIGIDIDSDNTVDVVIRWVRARMYFPKANIRLFISPSGRGYHMRIYPNEKVDFWNAIMVRAIIGDDPWRIKYNLEKYALSEGKENWNDIMFGVKNGNKEIEVEGLKGFEERYILSAYDNEVERKKRTKEAAERLKQGIDEVRKEQKIEGYVLCIPFNDNILSEMQDLQEEMIDRYMRGDSIKIRIYENFGMESDRLLVAYCTNDQKLRDLAEKTKNKYNLTKSWIKVRK